MFVEIYRETSADRDALPATPPVLRPGIFTACGFLRAGLWKIHANVPIDPTQVDFPEFVSHEAAFKSVYTAGELRVTVPIPSDETTEMDLFPTQIALEFAPDPD